MNYLHKYYKYLNKGICNIYTINDNVSIIKQETPKNIFWYLEDKKNQRIIYMLPTDTEYFRIDHSFAFENKQDDRIIPIQKGFKQK